MTNFTVILVYFLYSWGAMRVEDFCLFLSFYLVGIVNDNLHLAGEYAANYITVIWNRSEWKYTSVTTLIGKRTLIQKKGKEV